MDKTSSQDQCASSDSGQDPKAALFLCNPELNINADISQSIMQFPYGYHDPYISGLYTAYGPHNIIQPQLMQVATGRVPLPVDLPEDGPIYVNAKQYHGILRRRQTRAKLEAQNKLVKTRKPYLHESRHQHALKRVRGSGGRFLSTKKTQPSDSFHDTRSYHYDHQAEANTEGARVTTDDAGPHDQQTDSRFSSLASHMGVSVQGSGGFVYNGNRHYASIVR